MGSEAFTYHEKRALGFGTVKERQGKDSLGNYYDCCLTLQPAADPVVTPDGYLYSREAILESLLQQKKAIKRKLAAYEAQQADEAQKAAEQAAVAHEAKLIAFDRQNHMGISGKTAKRIEDAITAEAATMHDARGVKSAINIKEHEERAKQLRAFWVPSQQPKAKDLLEKPDASTLCPASGAKLRLKDCVAVKFTPVPEGEPGRHMDPVTKDTFTNASRLVVLAPTGDVVLEETYKACIKPEGEWRGHKLRERDVIKLKTGGTGFAGRDGERVQQRERGMPRRTAAAALLAAVTLLAAGAAGQSLTAQQLADWNAITAGVQSVPTESFYSSALVLFGRAFAVAASDSGECVVAATRFGKGRLVQFGHEGMLFDSPDDKPGFVGLITSAALWAGRYRNGRSVRLCHTDSNGETAATWLASESGGRIEDGGRVDLGGPLSPSAVDLLLLNGQAAAVGKHAGAIAAYVRAGGGVVIGGQAWYWSYSAEVAAHPNNRLTARMGIVLTASAGQWATSFAAPPRQTANAEVAARCLGDALTGAQRGGDCGAAAGAEGVRALMRAVDGALPFMPPASGIWALLQEAFARTQLYKHLPVGKLPVGLDAATFPGLPPADAQPLGPTDVVVRRRGGRRRAALPRRAAQRQGASPRSRARAPAPRPPPAPPAQVNATTPGDAMLWHSTGLYAPPGAVVKLTLPAALLGLDSDAGAVTAHIGGWTDTLYEKDEWARLPEVVRSFSLTKATTRVASALGGLIYVVLPQGLALGPLNVTVEGALRAATMRSGMTPEAWAAELAASPAPWGEVDAGGRLIIATPRASLAKITDAEAVTGYWARIMDSHRWLAGLIGDGAPPADLAPLRMQHDADISVGYMHSGYPIMTFMDVVDSTLEVRPEAAGHWGQLHELGHEHQRSAWTWGCTGEVTCNWFSARAEYAVRNQTDPATFYSWFDDPAARGANRRAYFESGPRYEVLCDDPALFLDSYLQLIEDGGWGFELLRATIVSYRDLPDSVSDASDEAKMATWVRQQSKAAGCNVTPHYVSWGWRVPLSDPELAGLPTWPNCRAR
ncbi:TCAF2 [Scenedesmus sp. PABB004]|nr:TCAF2 [Scenedesmus sp. PABB004]